MFRRMFGDAFPSTSDLALNLCGRADLTKSSTMLHLGCGVGSVSSLIYSKYGAKMICFDPFQSLIDTANSESSRDDLKFQCSDLNNLPFPNGGASHILTEAKLSIHKNPSVLLNEVKRCLNNDGLLMNSEIVITDQSQLNPKVNQFITTALGSNSARTLDDWKSLLSSNNFDVIESQIEPKIMRSNARKLSRALFGLRLLRRTGQFSLSDMGLGALEKEFDVVAKDSIKAINDGFITYASFISKHS